MELEPLAAGAGRSFWLVALSVALTLLVCEVAVRAAGLGKPPLKPRFDVARREEGKPLLKTLHAFTPFATIRSIYASNPRGTFDADGGIDHVFNSAGWRDLERTVSKPPGTVRILGLGDSYLFGQGVRREETVLPRLEAKLSERLPGMRFETINTGFSALDTEQEADVLRRRGLLYSPDLVILHFVLNDVEASSNDDTGEVAFFGGKYTADVEPGRLSRYSQLWSWLRQRILRSSGARRYIEDVLGRFQSSSPAWARTEASLEAMRTTLRQRGIPLLVVVFPFFHDLSSDYPFQPAHDRVRHWAEANGVAFLDLRDSYRAYSGPELWVHATDQHPNELAHDVAAEAIAEALVSRRDLLPQRAPLAAAAAIDPEEERRLQAQARVIAYRGELSADGKVLRFPPTPMADPDFAHVAPFLTALGSLQQLVLANTRITDESLPALLDLKGLRSLDLSHTQVSGRSLGRLATLADLEELRLDGLRIEDADLVALRSLERLRTLSLRDTPVTAAGAAAAAQTLPGLEIQR